MIPDHNILWISAPGIWGMSPRWQETIYSTEVTSLDLLYEGYLMDPPACLTLLLHWPILGMTKYTGYTRDYINKIYDILGYYDPIG